MSKPNPSILIKNWKRNLKTNFFRRWDNGSTEVHIHKVAQMSHPKGGRSQYWYFVEYSRSTGGFYHIGDSKSVGESVLIAIRWMAEHPNG